MSRHRKRSRKRRIIRILFFILITSPIWLLAGWSLLWVTGYISLPQNVDAVDG